MGAECGVETFHVINVPPKGFLFVPENCNNLSFFVSCKPTIIITGREDERLIKTYLKLEGGGFNFNLKGS